MTNADIVEAFLKMLTSDRTADDLRRFYHPEVEQTEFPNAILPKTVTRKMDDIIISSEKGKSIMVKEEFDILHLHTSGNTVILEAIWKGTVAVPIGAIPAGGQMIARFAQFFEFKDGLIYRQRNYDCFEPFQ